MERIEWTIADPRYFPWNPLIATSQAMHWRWKYRKHIFHPFDHKTNAINHRFPIHISFEIRCCVPTGHHTASTIHNQTRHTSFHWITKFLDAKHATFLLARESANYYRIRGVKVTDCTSFYNPLGEFPTPTWVKQRDRKSIPRRFLASIRYRHSPNQIYRSIGTTIPTLQTRGRVMIHRRAPSRAIFIAAWHTTHIIGDHRGENTLDQKWRIFRTRLSSCRNVHASFLLLTKRPR